MAESLMACDFYARSRGVTTSMIPDGHGEIELEQDFGEFILLYDDLRKSDRPEQTLLRFLESTWAAAASLGNWDRTALECSRGQVGKPPENE